MIKGNCEVASKFKERDNYTTEKGLRQLMYHGASKALKWRKSYSPSGGNPITYLQSW